MRSGILAFFVVISCLNTIISVASAQTGTTCLTNLSVVSSSESVSGNAYRYILSVKNTGTASIGTRLYSYSGSANPDHSSGNVYIPPGQTMTIDVPFNSCSAKIKIENTQSIVSGNSSSTSTCSSTIAVCSHTNKPEVQPVRAQVVLGVSKT